MNLKNFFKNHIPNPKPNVSPEIKPVEVLPSADQIWLNADSELIEEGHPGDQVSDEEIVYQGFLKELRDSELGSFTADQLSDLFAIYKQEGTLTQTHKAAVLTRKVENSTISLKPAQVIESDPIFSRPSIKPQQKPLPQGLIQYEGSPRLHVACRVVDEYTRQRTECSGTEAIKISGGQTANGTHRVQFICTTCGRGFSLGY